MRSCNQALLHIGLTLLLATSAMAQYAGQQYTSQGQSAPTWQPNLEAAQRVASQTGRLILIHFWTPSCVPCMRAERDVFSHPETFAALEANFVPVKINAEEAPATTRAYGVSSVPTDVVITPAGKLVAQCHTPPTAPQYVEKMTQIAAAHRQRANQMQIAARPPSGPVAQRPATPQPQMQPAVTPAAAPASQAHYMATGYGGQPPMVAPVAVQPNSSPAMQSGALNGPNLQPPSNPYAAVAPAQPTAPQYQVQARSASMVQLPQGSPPLGLDGYCPVQLSEQKKWVVGDLKWGAVHHGRTYLFAGPDQQKRFLANPQLYSPAMGGNDPVAAIEQGRYVPGSRLHGVFFDNRVFLFASEDALARFERNPERYSGQTLQASAPGGVRR